MQSFQRIHAEYFLSTERKVPKNNTDIAPSMKKKKWGTGFRGVAYLRFIVGHNLSNPMLLCGKQLLVNCESCSKALDWKVVFPAIHITYFETIAMKCKRKGTRRALASI